MKCITNIAIRNYRAFYNEEGSKDRYKITLPKGENILLYGENGSGKSSLFRALEDFFISSEKVGFEIQNNIFTEGKMDLPTAEIELDIAEQDPTTKEWSVIQNIILNNDAPTTYNNTLLTDASKAFLTYRDILKTYFLDIENVTSNPNLFDLILDKLLSKIIDSSTNKVFLDDLNGIKEAVDSIEEAISEALLLPDGNEPGKTQKETKGIKVIREEIVENVEEKILLFNIGATSILEEALIDVNSYLLDFFKTNIEVSIKNKNEYLILSSDEDTYTLSKKLFLDIKYYKQDIPALSYQVFLNEARLSSLAICIYLAAVKRDNPTEDNIKILFLDDIFIGLDTSNRVPLLEILNKDFHDYQIFITTYDHYWFELAKNWFDRRATRPWKFYELYADDYSYTDFELPNLLSVNDPLAHAINYYKKADYPASGNYLRRASEKAIKFILPPICLKGNDGLDISELSRLIENAVFFFKIMGVSTVFLDNLAVYLQSLMNPLSHYDIDISVFRKELKEVENSIENLLKTNFSRTKFKKILSKSSLIKLSYRVDAITTNEYEILIKDDLWIYQHPNDPIINLGMVRCKNENLYEIVDGSNGEIYHIKLEADSLRDFYEKMVINENKKTPSPDIEIRPDYENLYEYSENGKWVSIVNLIHFN